MNEPNGAPEDKSIGQILMEMGVCSDDQVSGAVDDQRADSEDRRIGMYLVARGYITEKQLDTALSVQAGLRSPKKHKRALAMSDIAEAASVSNIARARAVRATSERARAVTPVLVAKGKS